MFEFQDDFLMGEQPDEQGFLLCSVSSSLEKQLAELAAIVGDDSGDEEKGKTQEIGASGGAESQTDADGIEVLPEVENPSSFSMSEAGAQNETLVSAKPLFEIENELAAAFEAEVREADASAQNVTENLATVEETPVAGADDGDDRAQNATMINVQASLSSLKQPVADAVEATDTADVQETPLADLVSEQFEAVEAEESAAAPEASDDMAAADALPGMEFNDLIADELDRALAEEVEADPTLASPEAVAAQAEEESQGFEHELSRLMGQAENSTSAATPAPPAPTQTAVPNDKPEIVQAPAIPIVEDSPAYAKTAATDDWQPPQMSDFADANQLQGEPSTGTQHVPPANPDQISAIDAVLGASAAVGVAAQADRAMSQRELPDVEDYEFDPANEPMFQEPASTGSGDGHEEAAGASLPGEPDGFDLERELRIPEPMMHAGAGRRGGRRVAFAVLAVAALGGTAALAWNFVGDSNAPAKTILASNETFKEKPQESGGEVVPNQDQAVYRSVDGKASAEPEQEKLADKTEAPIRVAAKPVSTTPLVPELRVENDTSTSGIAPAAKSETRVSGTEVAATSKTTPVKARSVRTVVVKPDGTIISTSADQTSKSEQLDSAKPTYKPPQTQTKNATVKTVKVAKADPLPQADLQPAVDPAKPVVVPAAEVVPTPAPVAESVPTIKAEVPQPAEPVKTAVQAPEPKPAATPVPKPAPKQVAKLEPTKPKPVPVKKATVKKPSDGAALPRVSSPYAVQISSQRSVDAAKQSYSSLSRRYASILGGKGVDIRRTEIAGRGTFYRVRIPAQSKQVAQRMCSQLKKRGGDCLVTR